MNMCNRLFFSTILTAIIAGASLASAQGVQVGVNAAVKGDVTILSQGEIEAAQAVVSEAVFLGDEVNSMRISSLQVLLNDATTFTVGPDCVLTIDEFVYDPAQSNNSMKASVTKGVFRFMSGNVSKSNANGVTIDSPVASMGVRGTVVEGVVGPEAVELTRRSGALPRGMNIDPENATMFILRGPGPRSNSNDRKGLIDVSSGGKTVTVDRPGMATFVGATGAQPTDPFPVPDSVFAALSDKLRTKARPNRPVTVIRPERFDPITDMDWPGEPDPHGNGGTTPPPSSFCAAFPNDPQCV